MKVFAANSEHILIGVLQHLERKGWNRADIQKLVDVYAEFQRKTNQTIYGSVMRRSRSVIERGLDADIQFLVGGKQLQRSVSRIWLLPSEPDIVFKFDTLLAPLLKYASATFPPRRAP